MKQHLHYTGMPSVVAIAVDMGVAETALGQSTDIAAASTMGIMKVVGGA